MSEKTLMVQHTQMALLRHTVQYCNTLIYLNPDYGDHHMKDAPSTIHSYEEYTFKALSEIQPFS